MSTKLLPMIILAARALSAFASEQDDFWPLVEGNKSLHLVVRVEFDGRRPMRTSEQLVYGQEDFEGKSYFRIRTRMVNGLPSTYVDKLVRKDATGVYFVDPEEKDAGEQTELLLPLKVGQSWTKVVKKDTRTQTVVGVESASAAGTTYKDCYHIRSVSKDGKRTEDYWLAPGMGIVKGEVQIDNKITEWNSLTSFKRANPYSWTPPTPRPVLRTDNQKRQERK
jgi:hypothetical protein